MANHFRKLFTKNDKLDINQLIVKKTFFSFLFFFLLIGISILGWSWLRHQPATAGTSKQIRGVLEINERIFGGLLSDKNLAKEYPASSAVKQARVNGKYGLQTPLDSANWALYVIRKKGDTLRISLDDIKKLPKTEITFNFKCIEGWSEITHWGGVRFADFMRAYSLNEESAMGYLGLSTPDKQYYVGIDMRSALHPQTLLCYELNDQPLPLLQGYPLRLIIPVKYGIKSLKRIGTMYFDNERPRDYWAERGYDYFSGL